MGLFAYRKVRREVSESLATGETIRELKLLSCIVKGRVLSVIGEKAGGSAFNVPCATAVIEVVPGKNHRVTGFGEELKNQILALRPDEVVDVYGDVMARGGMRAYEIYSVEEPPAQRAA